MSRAFALCALLAVLAALPGCRRAPSAAAEPPPAALGAEQPEPPDARFPREIETDDLNEFPRDLAESAWVLRRSWRGEPGRIIQPRINDIDVVSVERTEDTLVPGATVFVAELRVRTSWFGLDADVIELLQPIRLPGTPEYEPPTLRPLLVLDGGYYRAGVSWRLVDLGVAEPRWALLYEDRSTVDAAATTVTQIHLYDADADAMVQVFDQVTRSEHLPKGPPVWKTTVQFRDSERALKDIVVSGRVRQWRGEPDHDDLDWSDAERLVLDEERTFVFRWDGERYVGDTDLPGAPQ